VDNAPWLKDALIELGLSPSSPRAQKPNRISLLILQTKNKNLLQQNNSKPRNIPKMEKGSGMLEPILQNIHIPLQPPKEVSLKLPRP